MKRSKVLIIGLGSIGKRHARLIQQHFKYDVVAFRSFLGQEPNNLGIPEIFSWEEVDGQTFDAAFITNPTYMHIDTAIHCAERGLNLFIEKPVDSGLAGLDDLLRIILERQLSTYVAYPFRFHPVVRSLKERLNEKKVLHASMVCASFLPKWRPEQDYRKTYSCYKEKGGGVFLDMSHELDMAEYLFGPILKIKGDLSRVSGLTVDSDDCADLLLAHEYGTTNIHLNVFSRHARRYIEVDTSDGYIHADLLKLRISDVAEKKTDTDEFQVAQDYMYLKQLHYFFNNLGRMDMQNNLLQASRLYKIIIEFREEQGYGNTNHHLC